MGHAELGSGTADVDLAKVYNSIRWAVFNSSDPASRTVNVSLANLIVGQTYKLQLLIGESVSAQRTFDIFVNGSQVADDFKPAVVQGSTALTKAGAAFVHQFTATSTTLSIVLDGSNVAQVQGVDANPILNGVTLARLPSTNASLANLTANSGTLSPSFDSGTTAYTAYVRNRTVISW